MHRLTNFGRTIEGRDSLDHLWTISLAAQLKRAAGDGALANEDDQEVAKGKELVRGDGEKPLAFKSTALTQRSRGDKVWQFIPCVDQCLKMWHIYLIVICCMSNR